MFKDRPGRKRVIAKEYEVIDAKGSPIEDLDWELKVLPGTRIAMGILIKAIAKSGTGFGDATHKCPRCNASNAGAMIEQGSLKWYVHIPRHNGHFLWDYFRVCFRKSSRDRVRHRCLSFYSLELVSGYS